MEIQYPTVEIPATPEYVLSVLLDRETLEWNNDSLSQVGVTLDSSIEVLYEACGFYTFDDIFYSTLICLTWNFLIGLEL